LRAYLGAVNGTIYDFPALQRVATSGFASGASAPLRRVQPSSYLRAGLITNPRSHRNKAAGPVARRRDLLTAAPTTRAELRETLVRFADAGVDLLVVNGGDGTVRDVLSCADGLWDRRWPRIAVVPSGKTNALAVDLGVPAGWTVEDALASARTGRSATRAPIAITRPGSEGVTVRGFLFGAGAFVRATELAQATHRAGAFHSVAVGLTIGWGIAQTMAGSSAAVWRAGERMRVEHSPLAAGLHDAPLASEGEAYLLLASTMVRMPLGVRPFGRPRPGLKTLLIESPPRRMFGAVPALLGGGEPAWLERAGYHRVDTPALDVELEGGFVLDGENFPGGRYRLEEAAPLSFVVP
jgi:diacylglycerol kinase (ATP)